MEDDRNNNVNNRETPNANGANYHLQQRRSSNTNVDDNSSSQNISAIVSPVKGSLTARNSLYDNRSDNAHTLAQAHLHDYGFLGPPLPSDENRLCVVLDMDETLLHSRFTRNNNKYRQAEHRKVVTDLDYDFTLCFTSGNVKERVFVKLRPKLYSFLEELSKYYEPILFTAALPEYAEPVMNRIDPHRKYVRKRLFRHSTIQCKGHSFVKDLSLLGRDMGRIVLLDNSPIAMLATPDNGKSCEHTAKRRLVSACLSPSSLRTIFHELIIEYAHSYICTYT